MSTTTASTSSRLESSMAMAQSYSMEILMQQNAALAKEIERLMAELDEVTMGVQMKGYLHKWRDREISFASKWGLRYFILQKNTISYFVDDHSRHPRRTIPLNRCIVKDEGSKRGGLYHIFSIYNVLPEEDQDDDLPGQRTASASIEASTNQTMDKFQTSTLLLRLSCSNEGEARLWIEMLRRACAMADTARLQQDDKNQEANRSMELLQQYQLQYPQHLQQVSDVRSENIDKNLSNMLRSDRDSTIVDTSIETWENHDIPESDSSLPQQHLHLGFNLNLSNDIYVPGLDVSDENVKLLSPMVLQRVKSATEVLKKSMSRPTLLSKLSASVSGNISPIGPPPAIEGNLSKKETPTLTTSDPSTLSEGTMKKLISKLFNLSNRDIKKKKKSSYVLRSFPASKNVHLSNRSSPLSSRVSEISYRGFFNLAVIIFMITHFRIMIDTIARYGSMSYSYDWSSLSPIIGSTMAIGMTYLIKGGNRMDGHAPLIMDQNQTWDTPQLVASIASWIITMLTSYGIEKVAAQGDIDESIIVTINWIIGILNLLVPCFWVWTSKAHPLPCIIYLFQSVVIWMKLISYAHVNRDLRIIYNKQKLSKSSQNGNLSPGKLSRNVSTDMPMTPGKDSIDASVSGFNALSSTTNPSKRSHLQTLFAEMDDLEPPFLSYPQNITIRNLLYFCIAPTLCYQLNYPRTKSIRWNVVATILFRLLVCSLLILIVVEQYIRPTLISSLTDMKEANILGIFLRLLKLSIPSTYVWLLSFYIYFHLWLNFLAEVTRFGDREFYKDWWNSRTIESYWRLWNLPVHHWMLRHLYYPILRTGASKSVAAMVVFGFSALFHEVVISVPFRYFALHAFFGMLAQAPLVTISKYIDRRFDNAAIGNVMFWMIFCVIGQPMGVIMYYYDFWKISQ